MNKDSQASILRTLCQFLAQQPWAAFQWLRDDVLAVLMGQILDPKQRFAAIDRTVVNRAFSRWELVGLSERMSPGCIVHQREKERNGVKHKFYYLGDQQPPIDPDWYEQMVDGVTTPKRFPGDASAYLKTLRTRYASCEQAKKAAATKKSMEAKKNADEQGSKPAAALIAMPPTDDTAQPDASAKRKEPEHSPLVDYIIKTNPRKSLPVVEALQKKQKLEWNVATITPTPNSTVRNNRRDLDSVMQTFSGNDPRVAADLLTDFLKRNESVKRIVLETLSGEMVIPVEREILDSQRQFCEQFGPSEKGGRVTKESTNALDGIVCASIFASFQGNNPIPKCAVSSVLSVSTNRVEKCMNHLSSILQEGSEDRFEFPKQKIRSDCKRHDALEGTKE